jgi:RNA recognition motif-containing protein
MLTKKMRTHSENYLSLKPKTIMDMDVVETYVESLSEEQVREILVEAARNHADILQIVKSAVQRDEGVGAKIPSIPNENMPPNRILCLSNLSEKANELMLTLLFQQFQGFRSVKIDPNKKGVAYVEYSNEQEASIAMQSLQHFKIEPEAPMLITYAPKEQK